MCVRASTFMNMCLHDVARKETYITLMTDKGRMTQHFPNDGVFINQVQYVICWFFVRTSQNLLFSSMFPRTT